MTVTRDVHFNEGKKWDWNNSQTGGFFLNSGDNHPREQTTELMHNELRDDLPIRRKRPLSDIYQRCNIAIYEPFSCEETLKDPKWKIGMEEEMSMIHKNKTEIFVDNLAAIAITNNPVCHGKTKHFNINLYFLIEMQQSGEVNLIYYKSKDQLTSMFTRSLPINKFELFRQRIGVCIS